MEVELQRKGWSAKEIAQAQKVLSAPASRHLHLWSLAALMVIASACFALFAFPIILFTPLAVSAPFMLLLGGCAGYLFTHALHSIRVPRAHHVAASAAVLIIGIATMALAISAVQQRLHFVPGFRDSSALLLAGVFMVGMALPYLFDFGGFHGSA